jgi:hypothetical protein
MSPISNIKCKSGIMGTAGVIKTVYTSCKYIVVTSLNTAKLTILVTLADSFVSIFKYDECQTNIIQQSLNKSLSLISI